MPSSCTIFICGILTTLLCAVLLVATPSYADERLARLHSAKTLRCAFSIRSSADSRRGDLKPSIEASSMVFVFDSIDLQESSARAVGNQGSSNEIALRTPSGITFIEKTNTGNHVFTTVFSGSGNTSLAFHAVTSRHMEMMGVVVISQWYGACEILPSQ